MKPIVFAEGKGLNESSINVLIDALINFTDIRKHPRWKTLSYVDIKQGLLNTGKFYLRIYRANIFWVYVLIATKMLRWLKRARERCYTPPNGLGYIASLKSFNEKTKKNLP